MFIPINPRAICNAAIVALFLVRGGAQSHARSSNRDRAEFFKAMSQVRKGMTVEQVFDLLGSPDDDQARRQRGLDYTRQDIGQTWCFGMVERCTLPTLGRVYFDHDGKVKYIVGAWGTPIAPELLPESEVRRLLCLIHGIGRPDSSFSWDPLRLVQATNALIPLGKEESLAIIDEYLRVTWGLDEDHREGIFFLLRTLFEIPNPPGYMPRVGLGGPDPSEPEDPTFFPRFPLAVIDDVPLFTINGYWSTGVPQQPEDHIDYFRQHGTLRKTAMRPGSRPLLVLRRLSSSHRWRTWMIQSGVNADREFQLQMHIAEQLLQFVSHIHPITSDRYGNRLPLTHVREDVEAAWKGAISDVHALNLVWNDQTQQYIRRRK